MSSFSRDAKIFTLTGGIRGFGNGFISIIIVFYLASIGISALTTGVLVGLAYGGSIIANAIVSLFADRIGKKRALLTFSLVQFILPMAMLVSEDPALITLAFFVGCITVTGSGFDQSQAIEQASLPTATDRSHRNYLFSFYNVSNSLLSALGSLFAGAQTTLQSSMHLQAGDTFRMFFAVYATLGLLLIVLYSKLSPQIEVVHNPQAAPRFPYVTKETLKNNKVIIRLSGLFAIDTFGSGLTQLTLLTLWFHFRFGAGPEVLSVMFFVANMIQTFSMPLAAKIADKIGLVRTMVVTQVPNNIIGILVGLSPALSVAVALYLTKAVVSMMDTPSRQAYTVSIVTPDKRTAAAAASNISRGLARTIASTVSGYLIQGAQYSLPFFVSSGFKLTYDLLLYRGFRHLKEQ